MCGRLQTQDLSRTLIAQPPPGVPPPPDDTSSLYNLVWYDNDQNPINGRPDHGGWWLRNPNGRGIVPNNGNIYRTATSLLGTYDAADPALIRQHAYWFAAMGARGIINDWTNSNFSTLPAYSEGVERATHTLMTEFSQANGNHPHLKVVIAVRIQAAASDTAVVLDRVAALYNQFPACTVRLNNGTPHRRALCSKFLRTSRQLPHGASLRNFPTNALISVLPTAISHTWALQCRSVQAR